MVHKYKYLKNISPVTIQFIRAQSKNSVHTGPFSEEEVLKLVKNRYENIKSLIKRGRLTHLYEEQLSEIVNNVLPDLLSNSDIPRELKWKIFPEEMETLKKRREDFRRRYDTMSMALAREYRREVDKPIRERLVRTAALEELCGDLQDGTAPSVEIHELAGLLGVDISKIKDRRSACSALRRHLEALAK